MGDQKNGQKGFKDPFEKDPGINVMKIIPVDDHLDELVGHHKGKDHARDGDDDAFGEAADHGKDAGIPEQILSRGKMIFGQKSYSVLWERSGARGA